MVRGLLDDLLTPPLDDDDEDEEDDDKVETSLVLVIFLCGWLVSDCGWWVDKDKSARERLTSATTKNVLLVGLAWLVDDDETPPNTSYIVLSCHVCHCHFLQC